ncbi:UNVERIFIED_CONTAM: hypothetical protein H355_013667 [Colinus virginianus]|nr:hypothetical protein H355_013667 [Colinus virginianus]
MKRYVPQLLLLLLSCAADEDSEALAKRAARSLLVLTTTTRKRAQNLPQKAKLGLLYVGVNFPRHMWKYLIHTIDSTGVKKAAAVDCTCRLVIALPCLIQLEPGFSLNTRIFKQYNAAPEGRRDGNAEATVESGTSPEASTSKTSSVVQPADEEAHGQTEDDDDEDDEDSSADVNTMEDIQLLEQSWSAAFSSSYIWPEQSPTPGGLGNFYADILRFLPFPFCRPPEPAFKEAVPTVPELKGPRHRQQQWPVAAEQHRHYSIENARSQENGEGNLFLAEGPTDPMGYPLQIAQLAYLLRHFDVELVQQALAEQSELATSPARCCRSLRTLRLLAALLLASPTVTEKPWSTVHNTELIRRILLHLYKICHHADALALQQSACVDDGTRNRATTGSSSLVEYAFLLASAQVEIIRREAAEAAQTSFAASGERAPAEEDRSRVISTVEKRAEVGLHPTPVLTAPQQSCTATQRSASVTAEKEVVSSYTLQETDRWDEDTPGSILASGALKSYLKMVQEAQKCAASIAAVAAPHEWLVPLAEHVLGRASAFVHAHKQRLSADKRLRTTNNGAEQNGSEGSHACSEDVTLRQLPRRRMSDKDSRKMCQYGGNTDSAPKSNEKETFSHSVIGARQSIADDLEPQRAARKDDLCGRPQYAFLLLGSMLWTIRKKRRLWGSRVTEQRVEKQGQGSAASGESLATMDGPSICPFCDKDYKPTIADVDFRHSRCGPSEDSQWTADDARFCFGIVEQVVYPDCLNWNEREECATYTLDNSARRSEDRGQPPSSVLDTPRLWTNSTESPCLPDITSSTLIATARQLPHEENSLVLYATSIIPVLVDMCRRLCDAEWDRVLFVLIRLRVEEKTSPLLVENAVALLCVDSIFTSVANYLAASPCATLPGLAAGDDIEVEANDSTPLGGCTSSLLPAESANATLSKTKLVPTKLASATPSKTNFALVCAPGLPRDRNVCSAISCLVHLIHSLLPCMLSCLDDDGQPDTRKMAAEVFSRFFVELESRLRSQRVEQSLTSAESSSATGPFAGTAVTTCTDKTGTFRKCRPTGITSTPPSTAAAKRDFLAGHALQSPVSSTTGGPLPPKPAQDYSYPRGQVPTNLQYEALSLCSTIYPSLLQRLDDARDTVRLAAAAALCSMLRFLGCQKEDHDYQQSQSCRNGAQEQSTMKDPLDASNKDAVDKSSLHRTEDDVEDATRELHQTRTTSEGEKEQLRRGTGQEYETPRGERSAANSVCPGVGVDLMANGQKGQPSSTSKPTPWRWPCLEYVVRGVVTFLDDQDEHLVVAIHDVLRLAGVLNPSFVLQGRVRTRTVKRAARQIVEKYYAKLTLDFQINKKISEEVAVIPSKRMRNRVAGFVTHLMKRIQKGPVRGISLKLQEEERERRMDFVPERSEVDVPTISIDQDAADMLRALDINLPNISVPSAGRGPTGPPGRR